MVGRVGALLTAPSGSAGSAQETQNLVGGGKLSGSLDEFRYWKEARSGKDIGKNWFTHVRGGTNTDISNAIECLINEKENTQIQKPSIGCNIKWK